MAKRKKSFQPLLECDYGFHDIFVGSYDVLVPRPATIYWTQAGDDCEGNSNGNPAADVKVFSDCVQFEDDDGNKLEWPMDECLADPKKVNKEINEAMEKYYSQFVRQLIRQSLFVRKHKS